MNRWKVVWTLRRAHHAAEAARLLTIFDDITPEQALEQAGNEKSRLYDRRPQAEFEIQLLRRRGTACEIKLISTERQRIVEHWINPTLESFMDAAAEPAEIARLIDDGFAFASGLSRSNRDLVQSIDAGLPVGVSVHAPLSETMRRTLIDYANGGGKVFVDSGSFTAFTQGAAIDWSVIMGRYKELFYRVWEDRRHNLYFVAPDVIGDADATDRLNRDCYGMFQFVMEDGGNMIVPVQKSPGGSINPGDVDDFWPRLDYPHRFIVGIPFNKMAWSEAEVLEWMARNADPEVRIHLLGGGPSKVRSLICKAREAAIPYGSITGDAFHGPARDRKFEKRTRSQPVTPQRETVKPLLTSHFPLVTPMKSNLTPESDFSSSLTAPPKHRPTGIPLFTFRSYQRDDMARAALHDGAIIGWDPGMGKTMPIFCMPFIKRARYALIVAPGGLHEQLMDEGRNKFGVDVTIIQDQEHALDLMQKGILPMPGTSDPLGQTDGSVDPKFFIVSYHALGYNGGDEWNPEEPTELLRARRLMMLRRICEFPDSHLANRMVQCTWDPKQKVDDWTALSLPRNSSPEKIRLALRTAAILFHPNIHGADSVLWWRWTRILTAACALLDLSEGGSKALEDELASDPAIKETGEALRMIEEGIGETHYLPDGEHAIKCVFKPTLASLLCGVFDFVACDEAVRIKSGTAYLAQGVLRMASRCRYALTGTPIKNKLPDFFFLASWVTGHTREAIARWPYGNTTEHRGQFARDFGVMEENLTKNEKAALNGKKAPPPKTTNQICNVHRLWRIIGPVIVRRRKDDVPDCDIVTKTIVPIRVMPGAEQKRVYKYHLDHAPQHNSILASIGAQLANLRQAALNPSSLKLTHGGKDGRSSNPWTPKLAAILQLSTDLLAKGEQVVIFSPFTDFSAALSSRFREAGIPNLLLDGNTSPAKRGSAIKRFKSREVPILIAGIDSMGEGHNLDNACNLVLPSLSWAFDSNSQAVDRVHRLTSTKPVTIYVMVTQGTIDERLASIWQEKGDSSDLALDGRLSTQDREEIDLGTLLRDAVKDFNPKAPDLDENEVAANWKRTLLPALTEAGREYARLTAGITIPAPAIEIKTTIRTTTPAAAPAAPAKRLSLYELMKNKNTTPPAAPQQAATPAPQAPNIIPFPGRLAAASAPAKGVTMNRVNIADLLRRK
jgi:hypothetical protein